MSIDPTVAWALGALIVVLVVAEAAFLVLRRSKPEKDWTELKLRIHSWWVIVIAGGIALVLNPIAVLVVLAVVSYLALKEYLSVVPTRRADRAVLLVAYLAIPTQWWWIAQEQYGFFIIWVPVYLFMAGSDAGGVSIGRNMASAASCDNPANGEQAVRKAAR